MKIFKAILLYISVSLNFIVSLVFAFVEIRPIFAGDFNLMQNPGASFTEYFFRFLFFALMFTNALYVLIKYLKKRSMDLPSLIFNATLVAGTALMFTFFEWYVVLIMMVLNVATLCSQIFLLEKITNEEQGA